MTILHSPIRILGFGSPIMGNDGVGLKVIEILKKEEFKELEGLDIEDAGVCGLDLLNLLDGARKVIIVDAILAGSPAGSVHRIEGRDLLKNAEFLPLISVHDLTITDVLMIGEQVQTLPEIVVIGIEIGSRATEITREISPDVLKGVDKAIRLIRKEVSSSL
ncbi:MULTISPECIES: hydrogenase maturation protease [Methanosarcina]|uniref:F420-nonreducing hydrogenase n=1 Tax=Methanosarcina mazei TaxID=2209 RepID=A0A0F8RFB8_METMZ|nr:MULTISPECIES: hydrogenase maturation protease [Methanosarcina]KKG00320.1 F420-nonreducing hydrogenase [Methanosarcina mazei]KKG00786.1 F420-nonreducing hydrogenase [Methanosarcina mazei]KKG06417.1 F420-nonreducing hydrogenase [Methanosarcina mazei]KKG37544.1 F420-nonreducing hydrogenase [Methanosarcina mazei]KKG52695.1 F420-nonreducing hydrogenase [Methanosarcina mazei]